MSEINFEIKGMGEFIKNNKFFVPIYQRPYSWEEKQVDELFDDIKTNLKETEYFLGTIVLTKKEEKLEIVDGQQRITTISIFFAALRNIFRTEKKDKIEESIQTDYLSEFDRREEKNISKLELSNQDNQFFKNYIVDNDNDFPCKRESHNRIKNAYLKALSFFLEELKYHKNDVNILNDWIDFIDKKLKIVVIIVPAESNAFTIFETLNDRGLLLAQIDLLKNYLYSKSGSRLVEVQNNWNELVSKLEALDEPKALEYIKVFWMSNFGFVREKNNELFLEIKTKFKSSTEVNTLVNDLNNDVELYIALLSDNSQIWEDYDSDCKEFIKTLNYLELKQYRPLTFAILKYFDKKEVAKSFKLIVSWMVRNLIIGTSGGGTLEQVYSKIAIEIKDKKITTASELRTSLKDVIPQDSQFENEFKTATVSKEKFARYYLRAMENFKIGGKSPELVVNSNPNSVNLEHILPKKPEKNYPLFNEEQHTSYLKRIGNLTIMNTKSNNDQKSAKYSEKRKEYDQSKISLTKELAAEEYKDDWNPNYIDKRQDELAKLAVKTWSLKLD